jgi:hypothetical protein
MIDRIALKVRERTRFARSLRQLAGEGIGIGRLAECNMPAACARQTAREPVLSLTCFVA